MSNIKSCTYQDLIDASNDDNPLEVTEECLVVVVKNLRKRAYYVAPIYLWAQEVRPIRVEIMDPNKKDTALVRREFSLGRNKDKNGQDAWLSKRYKLDKKRHNGTATLRIGWPSIGSLTAGCPFKIIAAPLTSKALIKNQRRDSGLCPACGNPGSWQAMAMVCKEHGVFLG